jgi:mRNA interferase MazF
MQKIVKRFLEWIKIKEKIHEEKLSPTFEEREIWWAVLGENIGHEENGRGDDFVRPFIVVRKFNKELLFGVPCSSVVKENKYYFKIVVQAGNFKTAAMLSQARSISSKRLLKVVDKIGEESFEELKKAIDVALLK